MVAVFGAGAKFHEISQPQEAKLVSCSEANGYPVGRWDISGAATHGPQEGRALAPFVYFSNSSGGTVQTDDPIRSTRTVVTTDTVGSFEVSPPLGRQMINQTVTITVKAPPYAATFKGPVSEDGCTIAGNWEDSEKHRGVMTFFWAQPSRYWVRPN
jgi:hypothetical protein